MPLTNEQLAAMFAPKAQAPAASGGMSDDDLRKLFSTGVSMKDQAAERLRALQQPPPEDLSPDPSVQDTAFSKSIGIPDGPEEALHSLVRAGGAAGSTILGGLAGGAKMLGQAAIGDFQGIGNDINDQQASSFDDVANEWQQGNKSKAIGKGVLGAVPWVGPGLSSMADKLFTPDSDKAVGEAIGMAAMPKVTEALPGIGRAALEKGGKIVEAGRRVVGETVPKAMVTGELPNKMQYYRRGADPQRPLASMGLTDIAQAPEAAAARIEPLSDALEARTRSATAIKAAMARPEGGLPYRDGLVKAYAEEIAAAKDQVGGGETVAALKERLQYDLDRFDAINGPNKGWAKGVTGPEEMAQMKRALGKSLSDYWKQPDPKGGSVTAARINAYRSFDNILDETVPGAEAINTKLADLYELQKAAHEATQAGGMGARTWKKLAHTASNTAAVGSAAAGALMGHPTEGVGLGAGITMAERALTSFPVRSKAAAALSKLATAEAALPDFSAGDTGLLTQQRIASMISDSLSQLENKQIPKEQAQASILAMMDQLGKSKEGLGKQLGEGSPSESSGARFAADDGTPGGNIGPGAIPMDGSSLTPVEWETLLRKFGGQQSDMLNADMVKKLGKNPKWQNTTEMMNELRRLALNNKAKRTGR